MKRWTVFMLFVIVSLCIPLSGEAGKATREMGESTV